MPGISVFELRRKAEVDWTIERLGRIIRIDAEAYGKDLIGVHSAYVVLVGREPDSRCRRNYGYCIDSVRPGISYVQVYARLGRNVGTGYAHSGRINLNGNLSVYLDQLVPSGDPKIHEISPVSVRDVICSLDLVIKSVPLFKISFK
jgi:hypothetical protein